MTKNTRMTLLFTFALVVATGHGCKKETEAPAPTPETESTPPQSESQPSNPEGETTSTTEPEKTSNPTPTEPPLTAEQMEQKEVTDLLRTYFDHLAHNRHQEAQAMLLGDDEACRSIFTDPTACVSVGKGQAEAMVLLAKDPVPFNSKITECLPGTKQMLDETKGAKQPTALWLGSSIRARGPTGYEFLMRSLGVVETAHGKRIMWGKRRAFGDTPRNPSPITIESPSPGAENVD